MTRSAPAANAVTNAPSADAVRSSRSRPATVETTEATTTQVHIRKTRMRVQPAARSPADPESASGTFEANTPTTTATGTAPSCSSDAPSTNDSGIPSSTVPRTIALALPASWLSPVMLLRPSPPLRSMNQSPT
jgi:hypothetical protein